jgi:hypothetical protein
VGEKEGGSVKFEMEGDDMVSTPIYLGDGKAVEGMVSCAHRWKDQEGTERPTGTGMRVTLMIQRCRCLAVRAIQRIRSEECYEKLLTSLHPRQPVKKEGNNEEGKA